MRTTLFTDGWIFRRAGEAASVSLRLPHDAMIGEIRSADAETGNHGGFFPGGAYVYARQWTVPAEAAERTYSLFFEGVYGDTRVLLDGNEVARCDSGYREFTAPLSGVTPGAVVNVEVHVDNTAVPNSRWYTGSGIYRPVWLESVGRARIARDGISIVTRSLSVDGTVDVAVSVEGAPTRGGVITARFEHHGTEVAREVVAVPSHGEAELTIRVPAVRPWSAESPHLYDVRITLEVDGDVVDEQQIRTGLRTVQVDAHRGLRINGTPVLLRGACVHHDNGILGAATFAAAEHRRARLLKEAGYNAIRSAHNPLSRAFLDACDELGLYVMDELTDVWFQHKTPHDHADRFEETWKDDADAMIAKDRNRASVIMYSIGNEIAETSSDKGVHTTRAIHRYLAEVDPTRPTTIAVNLLLNMMASRGWSPFENPHADGHDAKKSNMATSTVANMLIAKLGRVIDLASRLPAADRASRYAFAGVDIAGYNYAHGRYSADRRRYPERVMVGSESMPGYLPAIWRRVTRVPGVIGDFMWTGWDYLGEAGIGAWSYGDDPGGISKPYPALVAGSGAFDITGLPGAPAFLAKAVWDSTSAPGIAVRPLDKAGMRANETPWRTSDAVPSWSWGGLTGEAEVEVYSPDDQVELLINGRSLGRKRAGRRADFVTRFRAQYEPGEIVAVGYRNGAETGRSNLRTARNPNLRLVAEKGELNGPDDLAYIWVEFADDEGIVDLTVDDTVTISVVGAGTLLAMGNAAPSTTESYTDSVHSTYRGRALAVVRGTAEPGPITVTVGSGRNGLARLDLLSVPSHASTARPRAAVGRHQDGDADQFGVQ
ncbi:glycoside hydrolase family 2 TIM barrel-domain containing protein [Microbacterium sp. 2FI]|uniref:glycoside hydrolase family 2 TIM barrel-domain containing protein n=1 Tax=Microbacterium sp. 2FI TaxID=2502193 RepID=UPI0010F779E6|nr:glycoside hydrolase family 2 TIM barrel-domain containing protein [Microbacterium sp. 2FI]